MPNFSNGFKDATNNPKQVVRNLFPNNPSPAKQAAPLFGGGRVEAARQAPPVIIAPLDGGIAIGADAGQLSQPSEPEEQISGDTFKNIRRTLQPTKEKADDGRPDIVIQPRKKVTYTVEELRELGLDNN
jgi:hypothetical protein